MAKTIKVIKVTFSVIYIIAIFFLMLNNEQLINSYGLPTWLIPCIFFVSIFYICCKYILLIATKDNLEEEIISIVNHTFRTPITSILWHAKELEKNIPQNEKLLYLQNINNNTGQILNVIDILVGIKNIKNTSSYQFSAISIREIIEKSIKKYRDKINKKNISFQVSTFKDIPLLTLDLNKISFVIDTLVENAISYTKPNGKILIDCISNSKRLEFFVSDTGIGLNTIDKIMIFHKFYRNKRAKLMNTDGMGLRLYLSKEIVKRHHGKIYAKSNGINEGTTFFVELPFRK